jgi:hypothetical protein
MPMQVGNGATAPEADRDAIWCQMPDYEGNIASQIDYAYPFDAGSIDDFMAETDCPINQVQWWGNYFNGTGLADYFLISVDLDTGQCYPADEPFYVTEVFDYTEDYEPDTGTYVYTADIPEVEMVAGQAYWLLIQAIMEFSIGGQWGWLTSSDLNLCDSMIGFPLLDIPYWTPVHEAVGEYYAFAFCLYCDTVAAESKTWGSVKQLYR